MKNYYDSKVFWAFFFSSFLITMAGSGVNTFFPILLSNLGFEYSIIGLIVSAARAIGAISQIFIGSLIDRQTISRKKQILVMLNLLLSFSLLSIFLSDNLLLLIIILLVYSIWSAATQTVSNTIISRITPKHKRSAQMGLFRASISIGVAMGGIILGTIVNFFGLKHIFLLGFLLYFISSTTIFLVNLNDLGEGEQNEHFTHINGVTKSKSLNFMLFLISWTLMSMVTWADNTYVPLLIVENKVSAGLAGIIMGSGALIEAPIFVLIGKLCDVKDEKKIMAVGSLLFILIYLLTARAETFWQFFIIQVIRGISFGLFGAAALSFVVKFDPNRAGWAFGFYFFCLNLSGVLGPFISGIISNLLGLKTLFVFHGFISLVAFVIENLVILTSRGKDESN